MLHGFLRELDAVERDQFEAILRTNIHTSTAKDAHAAILWRALEYCIDPAVQTALGFFDGRLRVVTDLDFGHASAALQRQHGNGLAVDVEIVQRHAVAFENFDLDNRFGMLLATQILVNANGSTLPVGNAVDDEAWSEDAIPASEDAARGGH